MERESFGSKAGFIFAAASSAIGLGNFWRFPYLAESNGGIIFILIYIIFALTFGLVLMFVEVAISRRTGKSPIEAYRDLSKKFKWVGWIPVIAAILIMAYYCTVGGWVLKYAFAFMSGDIALFGTLDDSTMYFNSFISNSGGFLDGPVIWFVIFLLMSTVFLLGGIKNGVEKISKIFLPILLIMLVALVIYVMTLPGIGAGLERLFAPNYEDFSGRTVVSAASQLFFATTVGSSTLIVYGSYLKKDINIVKSLRTTAIVECIVAIGCAMLIVPLAGLLPGAAASGTGLAFETLPVLFANMEGGRIIGAAFFIMVFFAAWTSALSLAEATVTPLNDTFKCGRKKALAVTTAIMGILGLLCCLSYGSLSGIRIADRIIINFVDFFTCSVLIPLGVILMCLILGYIVGLSGILNELAVKAESLQGKYLTSMVKFVCPAILVIIVIWAFIDG